MAVIRFGKAKVYRPTILIWYITDIDHLIRKVWVVKYLLFIHFFAIVSLKLNAQVASQLSYRSVLNLELPNDPKAREQELWQKRIDQYMEGIRQEIDFAGPSSLASASERTSLDQQARYDRFSQCMFAIRKNHTSTLVSTLKSIVDECERTYKELNTSYMDALNQMGNNTPAEFVKRLQKEMELAQRNQNIQSHRDEIRIVDDFSTLDQIEFQLDPNINIFAPVHAKLASEVVSVLVELYQSDDVTEIVLSDESNDAMLEVAKLGHMVSVINTDQESCRFDLMTEDQESSTLSPARSLLLNGYVVHDREQQPAITAFFGLKPEELKKIQAYRFIEDDQETWLFRDGRGGLEEVWVMAELDPQTKELSYRHFVVRQGKQEQPVRNETISLLPQFAGGIARNHGRGILFETNLGVKIETDRQDIPLLGHRVIPSGRVLLGSARHRTFGGFATSDTRIDIDIERVSLHSTLHRNNNNWSVSAATHYKTFDNKWHASLQTRVYNIFTGYAVNSKKEFEYHLGLVVKQNYAKVQVDQNQTSMTIGRQFQKKRGGAAINTNFKNSTQLRLYLFL